MLTLILFFATIVTLAASWYRERQCEADSQAAKMALHIIFWAQVLVAVLAVVNVVKAERDAKELRVAQIDKEVLVELFRHQIPILDNYFVLIKTASVIRNYSEYKRVFEQLPPQLQNRPWEVLVPQEQVEERDAARAAFWELQRISREVLALHLRYGERVPPPVVEWASITLGLAFEQIPTYARATPEGLKYATTLGNGIGFSVAKLQDSLRRLEQ